MTKILHAAVTEYHPLPSQKWKYHMFELKISWGGGQ